MCNAQWNLREPTRFDNSCFSNEAIVFGDEDIQGSCDRSCQELVFFRAGALVPLWYRVASSRALLRLAAGVQPAVRSSSLLVVESSGFCTVQLIRYPFGVFNQPSSVIWGPLCLLHRMRTWASLPAELRYAPSALTARYSSCTRRRSSLAAVRQSGSRFVLSSWMSSPKLVC